MTILSVTAASTYYVVRIEWDAWVAPSDKDLRVFASGAASLRDGGPVGEAAIHSHDADMFSAEVWVNALSADGARF